MLTRTFIFTPFLLIQWLNCTNQAQFIFTPFLLIQWLNDTNQAQFIFTPFLLIQWLNYTNQAQFIFTPFLLIQWLNCTTQAQLTHPEMFVILASTFHCCRFIYKNNHQHFGVACSVYHIYSLLAYFYSIFNLSHSHYFYINLYVLN